MLDNYRKGQLSFAPKCNLKLLDGQFRSMIMYKTHLKERAKLESINLEEIIDPITENKDDGSSKVEGDI